MKPSFLLLLLVWLIANHVGYGQESSKLIELKGRIDVVGSPVIEPFPINNKTPDSVIAGIREINSVIAQYSGKSINVLNGLAEKGYELITALYICNDKSNDFNGNILLYYLRKKISTKKKV